MTPHQAMRRHTVSNILFWTIAAIGALLLAAFVLALAGVVPVESPPAPVSTAGSDIAPRESASTRATATPPSEPARRPTTAVVIAATRGESWFSARLGSEDGRVLDERVLAQGESARFEGERIWLSVGAAGNVDVMVDGKRRAIAPGTVSLVLTRSPAHDASS